MWLGLLNKLIVDVIRPSKWMKVAGRRTVFQDADWNMFRSSYRLIDNLTGNHISHVVMSHRWKDSTGYDTSQAVMFHRLQDSTSCGISQILKWLNAPLVAEVHWSLESIDATRLTNWLYIAWAPRRTTRKIVKPRVVPFGTVLSLSTTASQKWEAVPRRARISGSYTLVSLNSRPRVIKKKRKT